jgi:hypothetical protein
MSKTLSSFILVLVLSLSIGAQNVATTSIPKDDMKKIIAQYRSRSTESFVNDWMRRMPPPATTNAAAHKEIVEKLPAQIAKLRIADRDLEEAITQVLAPVLSQYGRSRSYQVVVINYSVPTIMTDSIATLVISTGLLQRAPSDDALLGAVGHEIAHEFYARRLRELKQQYTLLATSENGPATETTRIEIAKIELDCDAFAAMTLAVIGRNPNEFSSLLTGISKDFKEQLAPDHPSADLRAQFITSIVPEETLQVKPQVTKQLLAMKSLAPHASTTYSRNKN